MNDELIKNLNRTLKYGADHETVQNLLTQLSSPDHLLTRVGHPSRTDYRGVVSDALRDHGRDGEADLLQGGGHVVVHEGKVVPGRFTKRHLQEAMDRVDHELFRPEVMPPGPHRTTAQWGPSLRWSVADELEDDPDGNEEAYHQDHVDDTNRHLIDHTDGIPSVGCTDDTCNTDHSPIHQAGKNWKEQSLKWQLRAAAREYEEATGNPMTQEQKNRIWNHPLVKAVVNAPVEEPVPDPTPEVPPPDSVNHNRTRL